MIKEIDNEHELYILLEKYRHLPIKFLITFYTYCLKDENLENTLYTSSIAALKATDMWLEGKTSDEEVLRFLNRADDACVSNMRHVILSRGSITFMTSSLTFHLNIQDKPLIRNKMFLKHKAEFIRMLNSLSKVEKTLYDVKDELDA